jgi:hypothetical protein
MELLATGLQIDTLDEIISEMQGDLLAGISTTLNLQAPDPIAVMTDVMAERLSSLEELAGALYSGMQPDNATGDQLEGVTLITGTTRQPASKTLVDCSITVTAAFAASAGTMFASVVGAPNLLYTNVDDFSAAGAGTTTGVTFQCVDTGDNVVNAGTLTVIASPLANWSAITNPADGVPGRAIENDADLRLARQQQLALGGSTSAAAIAADVLAFIQPSQSPLTIPGILVGTDVSNNPFTIAAATISVTVLKNDSDSTDSDGLPPRSLEVIAYNGGVTDTEGTNALCALILADKAAGIQTYSGIGTSKDITDDQGIVTTVYYTRPVELTTLIAVTVKQRAGHTVTEAEVQDAIMAYIAGTDRNGVALDGYEAHWTPGATGYASAITGAVFSFDIAGVANVTGVTLSAANSGANIVPTVREIIVVVTPTADIVVTIT